jgi:hypothetical protein
MKITSRRIDDQCWLPEEHLCIERIKEGFELSIKVNREINITDDDYEDLTEYNEDGFLRDDCDYDFKLPKFIRGEEVSHWETWWSDDDSIIVFSTELEDSKINGGYEPLVIQNNKALDSSLKAWFKKNGFESQGESNSSFTIKFNELVKKINEFIDCNMKKH